MNDIIKISSIKGKRLNRLATIIDQLKPGAEAGAKIKEWKAIKDNSRRVAKINAFLSMNSFEPAELKEIKKYVYRIIIPWKLILVLFFLGAGAFLITQYLHFQKIPMVYAYGNDLKIYAGPDEKASLIGQMDIYSQQFAGDKLVKTSYIMLLTDSIGTFLAVKKNSFIQWLINKKPDGYVKRDGLLFSKKEYVSYSEFFGAIKGLSCLHEIPNEIKRTFFRIVNKEYPGAVLANDYPDKVEVKDFSQALYQSMTDGSSCLLFRLTDASDSKKNLVMRIAPDGNTDLLPLVENGRPLNNSGLFKKGPGTPFPDILFYNSDTKKTVKSLLFPYDQYQ